jgi:hypothetical protein
MFDSAPNPFEDCTTLHQSPAEYKRKEGKRKRKRSYGKERGTG